MDVLVTGGTGWLGRRVVAELRGRGHRARVLSRRPGSGPDHFQGDLGTGAGLEAAGRGADAIVHAGSATRQVWRYREVDVDGTRRLLELARAAGVGHAAYVSIVGIDRVPSYPYYRVKRQTEGIVGAGGVPFSILRATQFPELIDTFLRGFSTLPGFVLLPAAWKFQVVHTRDVAAKLADVVTGEPAGMLPDFGGPKVQTLGEMAAGWLAARRSRRRVVRLPVFGRTSRAFAAGALLSRQPPSGTLTWDDWLRERYGAHP